MQTTEHKKSVKFLLPPGPKGRFYVGSLPERRRDPIGLFLGAARTYGDVVCFSFGPRKVFLVNSHENVKHVLVDNHKNYIKGFGYDKLEPMLGKGLLTSEGEFWRQQRKLSQPIFHRQRLAALADAMTEKTAAMLDGWEQKYETSGGQEPIFFDVAAEMMRLTLRVVSQTLLGTDISGGDADAVGKSLTALIAETNRRILSLFPLPLTVPTPQNIKIKKDLRVINDVVYRIIKEHRQATEEAPDLLTMLMKARDEDTGIGMTDTQLRDEVMTMFLAGHETTANALSWTLYLLSKNPGVERKLVDELESVLGGRRPGFNDLSQLKYTAMVLEEALRLYPPAWIFSREAVANDVIGGFKIPKNGIVVMSPYVTHRNTKYWDNPEGFDPERFTPENSASRPKFAYFPFSGGPRICIGQQFAMMEAQLVLAMVLQKYRCDLMPGYNVQAEPLLTLRPRGGLMMGLVRRKA